MKIKNIEPKTYLITVDLSMLKSIDKTPVTPSSNTEY